MTEVVSFSELAKSKEQRLKAKQDMSKKSTNGVEYSTEGKFIMFGDIEVGFGGAFQRDIIKNLNDKRDQVIEKVLALYDKESALACANPVLDEASRTHLETSFTVLKVIAASILANFETNEQFDKIFDNETEELLIISEIVLAVMYVSYTEFDYQRMLRDRWFTVDVPIAEFTAVLNDTFE